MAIASLIEHGVREENIIFINMVAAPEGVKFLYSKYSKIRTISCALDSHLNEVKYIVPGLGDFGDRYFGTDIY
jgi:uracil phosphoribosyltransferase